MENFIHVASQGLMISAAVVFVFLNARAKSASNRPLPLIRHKIAAFLLLTAVYVGAVYGNQWLKDGRDYDYMLEFSLDGSNQVQLWQDKTLLKTIIPGLKKKAKKNNALIVEIESYGSVLQGRLNYGPNVVEWSTTENSIRSQIEGVLMDSLRFPRIIYALSPGIKKGQKLNERDFESNYYKIKFRVLNVDFINLTGIVPHPPTLPPGPKRKTPTEGEIEGLIDPLLEDDNLVPGINTDNLEIEQ